ncbi:MAG: hypothetical protein IJL52_08290, partial [Clostridia bacterium]|nr:hypothetical protein [Clostridia bacterium]
HFHLLPFVFSNHFITLFLPLLYHFFLPFSTKKQSQLVYCGLCQQSEAPAFCRCLFGGDEGDRTPYLLNAIQALSQHTRKRTPHRTKVATLHFTFTLFIIRLPFACKISLSDVE